MLINPNLGISSYIQNPVNKNQNSKRPVFNKAQFRNLQPLKHDTVSFKASLPSSGPLLAAEEELALQVPLEQRMQALLNKIKQMRDGKNCQMRDLLSEITNSADPKLSQAFDNFLQEVRSITERDSVEEPKPIETDLQDHLLVNKMNEILKKSTREKNENSREIRELLSEIPENNPAREACSSKFKNIRKQEMKDIDLFNLRFQMANPSISDRQRILYMEKFFSKIKKTSVDSLEKERDNFSQLASNPKFSTNTRFLFHSMVKRSNFHLYVLEVRNSALPEEEKILKIKEKTLLSLSSSADNQAISDIYNSSKQALTTLPLENPENKDLVNRFLKDISDKCESIQQKSKDISEIEESELSNSEKIDRMMDTAINSKSNKVSFIAVTALKKIKKSDSTQAESIDRATNLINLHLSEITSSDKAKCIERLVNNVKRNPTTENKQRLLEDLDNISRGKDYSSDAELSSTKEAHEELINAYSYLMREEGFEIAASERYKACKKDLEDKEFSKNFEKLK